MTGSENKPFVSMPSYQTQTGDYAQYALPITKDFHEKLSNAVLRSYQSLGKTEYKGVKYAELGDKDSIAHLPKQNNKFAEKLMTELDKAGVKYQAKVEGTTTISVNKADMPKVTDIKNQLVKTLNPENKLILPQSIRDNTRLRSNSKTVSNSVLFDRKFSALRY